jgi:cytochrome c biogenesis protein CcmG, thiol:disulfide interchange protein DsbE
MRALIAAPALLTVLLAGCAPPERVAEVGQPAPAYEAVTLEGERVRLSSLRGEVVLLNVWATWCRPCVREMPSLEALHREMEPYGLRVVAVSIDGAGSADMIRDFLIDHGITFDILHDPGIDVARRFGTVGVPETFLIDRHGVVRDRWIGMIDTRAPRIRDPVIAALRDEAA